MLGGSACPARTAQDAASSNDASLQSLAYQLTVVESRERERIARGLHDEIGQILTMARFKVGELRQAGPMVQASLLDELAMLLSQATKATRSATFELSCPSLRLGLQEALESLAQRLMREGRLRVEVQGRVPPLHLPETVLAVVFRVVRELGLNVQKHAGAGRAWIRPRCDGGWLCIAVADDGAGFDTATLARGIRRDGGFGLSSARAQMQALGGRLDIASSAGAGTVARLALPLSAE